MALVGTWKKYNIRESETETESFTFTVPENLLEGHPDYELRGQEKTFTQPKLIEEVIETIENAYIVVKAVAIHLEDNNRDQDQIDNNLAKAFRVNILYNIYIGENERKLNFISPYIADQNSEIFYIDLGEIDNSNMLSWAYSKLKTMRGFEDLIDN